MQRTWVRFFLAEWRLIATGADAAEPIRFLVLRAERVVLLTEQTRRIPLAVGPTEGVETERIVGGLTLLC